LFRIKPACVLHADRAFEKNNLRYIVDIPKIIFLSITERSGKKAINKQNHLYDCTHAGILKQLSVRESRFFAGIFPKLLGFVLKKLFTNAPTVLQKQKGVLAIIAHRAACQIPGAASPLFCSGLSVSLP